MNPGDLTTLDNAKAWLGLSGLLIAGVSNANPCVVTLLGAPQPTALVSGLTYSIAGVLGPTDVNADWPITVISPTSFSIPLDTSADAAYIGGGFVGVADPLVARLISATSAYIQNWLNRTIASQSYTQQFNGQDSATLMLAQYPVTAINAVSIDGIPIPPRPPFTYPQTTNASPGGYVFQSDGQVALAGCYYRFTRGYGNVSVSWDGGFLIPNEAQIVPASAPYTLSTLARWSAGDRGVIYSNGTSLMKVSGAPNVGQYSVDGSIYTFNAADAGAPVFISYAYVPFDIEQACIDTMGDWFKYRDRIGVTSKSIDAQSISVTQFVNTGMPARAKDALAQYKRTFPS